MATYVRISHLGYKQSRMKGRAHGRLDAAKKLISTCFIWKCKRQKLHILGLSRHFRVSWFQIYWFEKEGEKEKRGKGVRPPPECALRQVTALLSPAPLRLRMVCMGWGVWRGGEAGRERELSDRHCRPYAAGKQQKSLSTFPV